MVRLPDLALAAIGLGDVVAEQLRPPAGAATARWGVGIGEFAADLPQMPGLLRGVARRLNQFGSVVISPVGLEFDGDAVDWSQVTEVRTHRLVGYLFTDAIGKQADRLPLWWFPGRGLVIGGLSRAALTAVAVVADGRLDGGVFAIRIPAEVRFRGPGRGKQMTPGLPAALVLADPAVRDCVTATARAHGIPVRPADDDALERAAQRAAAIRSTVGTVAKRVTGFGRR